MYIYSFLVLVLAAYLTPHIRKEEAWHCLMLAWLFIIDTVVNMAFTGVFAVGWWGLLGGHAQGVGVGGGVEGMMNETAGFTTPIFNVSHVEVVTLGKGGLEEAATLGAAADTPAGMLGNGFQEAEGITSGVVVGLLWAFRFYLMFVVMGFAREAVRRHVAGWHKHGVEDDREVFVGMGGLKGSLGRAMVRVGRGYWVGSDREVQEMMRPKSGGLLEKERRRKEIVDSPGRSSGERFGKYAPVKGIVEE